MLRKFKVQLEAIKLELENDHLESYTQIVHSETLADLHDQAEHLLSKGYFGAAGVIGRSILEEHLRNTCNILETKNENEANRLVGNNCNNAVPELTRESIAILIADLPSIIEETGVY